VDPETGRDLWARRHQGPIHVVLQLRGGEPAARFRVQVASLSDEGAAGALRDRIEKETGEVAVVTHDPHRDAYRIRVGASSSRDGIQIVEGKVRAMGFAETWVVQETVGEKGRIRLRLVDEEYEDLVIDPRPFLALPASGRAIEVNGKPYRGVVEIRILDQSRLKAVNILNLEEYLKGVVPLELGPSLYPEIEALKAQAVAARTYVVANKDQFGDGGYDICDTARCQVYGGMDGEDPVTDEAIAETGGLVLTSDGEPIHALYTATCGGHTEDVENVFREEAAPYLRGITCYAEEDVLKAWRRVIRGALPPRPVTDPSGERIDDGLAILKVRGILGDDNLSQETMSRVATPAEIEDAVTRALKRAGKKNLEPQMSAATYPTTAAFASYLVGALGWRERVETLLDARDLPSLLGGDSFRGGPGDDLREAAYLIKEGVLPPRLGPGDNLLAPATRALLYRALYRILVRYEATGLNEGIFRGARENALILVPSEGELAGLAAAREVEPASGVILARAGDDGADLVPELTLVPGDRISYFMDRGRATYIRQKANVRGASDDRFTAHYQWETRYTREELEEKIRRRASIGRLVDVIPLKRGVSGRVSALRVVGSRGRFTFRGFGIRSLLEIKENLFVVDRQRGRDGQVETFIFAGKGWGHGVGLCQVGAFGMALRGATYLEILNRYYTDVAIEPLTWE
jgi:stage II sporulation protein D